MSKKLPNFDPKWTEQKKWEYFEVKLEREEVEEFENEEEKQSFEDFTKQLFKKPLPKDENLVAIIDRVKKSLRYKRVHGSGV